MKTINYLFIAVVIILVYSCKTKTVTMNTNKLKLEWKFEEIKSDDEKKHTKISLIINGKEHVIEQKAEGTYSVLNTSNYTPPETLSSCSGSWQNISYIYIVVKEIESFVIKKGQFNMVQATEVYYNFEEIKRVK